MTLYTSPHQLPYLEVGQPIRDTRAVLELLAKRAQDALNARGVAAPGAGDVLAVAARVSALEAGRFLGRLERKSAAGPATTSALVSAMEWTAPDGTVTTNTTSAQVVLPTQTRVAWTLTCKTDVSTVPGVARAFLIGRPGGTGLGQADVATSANVLGSADLPKESTYQATQTWRGDTLLAAGTWQLGLAIQAPIGGQSVTLMYEGNPAAPSRPFTSTVLTFQSLGPA